MKDNYNKSISLRCGTCGDSSFFYDGDPSPENFIPRGLMWDLRDNAVDFVVDPNNPSIWGWDNISGFTPNMIFNGLTPNVNNIRNFRDRLRTLHLGDTPNNAADFNNLVDIYDVFN
jgi:hypothetical protein